MFSKKQKSDFTSQDFHKIFQNITAQEELVSRQLKDGSMSKIQAQSELQRLSSLKSSYRENMQAALEEEQRSSYSPK